MSLLGDLGRALALLYPYRVPIAIGAAIPRVGIRLPGGGSRRVR